MKVLFVISSLNTGGAQRALSNIVTHLPKRWKIDILLNNTYDIVYSYRGDLIDLKIREPKNRNSVLYQFKVLVKRFFKLRKLKKHGCYDACISFLDSANIANIITGKKHCKTIISARNNLGTKKDFMFRCVIYPVIRRLYNRADSVVAVSGGVENELAGSFGIRAQLLSTIYNGFSQEKIKTSAGLRMPGNIFTFITSGRCDYQKGQWHLVRVFAEFAKKHKDSRLVILGDGPYTPYLSQLITAYSLEDKVLLKGFISNPFIELVNANVFVFPSMYEGLPNALIEAMACDIPIIATDFRHGAREILAPSTDISYEQTAEVELAEYGIITPVCSGTRHSAEEPLEPQEMLLLEAMELMYTDNDIFLRYCAASKTRAADFSIEKTSVQWQELIEATR